MFYDMFSSSAFNVTKIVFSISPLRIIPTPGLQSLRRPLKLPRLHVAADSGLDSKHTERRPIISLTHRSMCINFHLKGVGLLNSYINSVYFYSASSSPLLLRGAPDTARILRLSFTPKRHRQLQVKDLSKIPACLTNNETPKHFTNIGLHVDKLLKEPSLTSVEL